MLYEVKYKKPGAFFWRKIKNVDGDGFVFLKDRETGAAVRFPMRYLMLADHTRIELPLTVLIKFSSGRFEDEQARMSKEAGQKIDVPPADQGRKKR